MWSYSYFPDHFNAVDLIRLVERQPVLWNPYHADHSNKQQRNKAWERIAAKIVINWANLPDADKHGTAGEIKNKWKNIKDTYTKDLKIRSTDGSRKKRKYIYTDILQFLNVQGCAQNFTETTNDKEKEQNITLRDEDLSLDDEIEFIDNEPIKTDPEDQTETELIEPSKIKFVDMYSIKNDVATSSDCDSNSENHDTTTSSIMSENGHLFPRASSEHSSISELSKTTRNNEPGSSVGSSSSGRKRGFDEVSNGEETEAANDPDRMFLLSMLPLFKKLGELEKLSARIQLTQVLQKLLYPKK